MKYIHEFRAPQLAKSLAEQIKTYTGQTLRFMEFCGGHTHSIMRYGLRPLVSPVVELVSGPGCPVCVSSTADIDKAIALVDIPELILATFGDMIRVPGSRETLQDAKARGADIRIVYSSLDALHLARTNPERPVVMLGIGFETTAPTIAASVLQAEKEGLENFYVLSLHKLTPPATRAILDAGDVQLDGILGPGHVTAVIGTQAWQFLPETYGIPCAISGFEPVDILQAIAALTDSIQEARPTVHNAYRRGASTRGNPSALDMMYRVFEVCPANWRGLGVVPDSGLRLREEFSHFDAEKAFEIVTAPAMEHHGCRCGDVLRGMLSPTDCPLFAGVCDPDHPVGPCMVSSEGACAAYYQYRDEL